MERISAMRILLINLLLTLINYIVITTIVDIILMGMPHLLFFTNLQAPSICNCQTKQNRLSKWK